METLEERIALARDIKRFAVEELGISPNPSFERVEEDSNKSVFYGIYCSYKNRIESAVGQWGFIRCDNIFQWHKKSAELKKRGLDTYAVTWEALSFRDCPITKSLLKSSEVWIAFAVLHENIHIQHDAGRFNLPYQIEEGLANCFGYNGSEMYFSAHAPQMIEKVNKKRESTFLFYDMINYYIHLANEAYGRNFEEGRAVLEEAEQKICPIYISLRDKNPKKLNNAFLLSHSYYSAKTKAVWERLKDIHPKEYMQNKNVLYARLADILPQKAE